MWNDALCYQQYGAPETVLALHHLPLPPLAPGLVRVQMRYAPVNPSDLIPITGAYRHRTTLPSVAGYEGVGVVVEDSTNGRPLLGQRVLPLRAPEPGSVISILTRAGWCRSLKISMTSWPRAAISIR